MPLSLSHLNLPARDPEALARWYESTFGFERRNTFVLGPGTLLAFEKGDPLGGNVHFGFGVASATEVVKWAARLGVMPVREEDFASLKKADPEGNVIEIYWEPYGPSPSAA
jgi:catechol 2,3-dioxygenase-like lactoylglutathione lyase family enzyme